MARGDFGVGSRVGLIDIGVHRFHGQMPAVGHRVSRIDRKVQDRGLQRIGIRLDLPEPGTPHRLDGDGLTQRSIQQVLPSPDQRVDIDRFGIERLTSRKRQQPLGQGSGLARTVCRLLDGALEPSRIGRGEATDDFEVAEDHLQNVVEVVSDAARELSDRFHLLRLPDHLFTRA